MVKCFRSAALLSNKTRPWASVFGGHARAVTSESAGPSGGGGLIGRYRNVVARVYASTSRFMMLPHRDDDTTLRGTASLEVEEQAAQKTDGREHNPAARRPARACLLHACRVDVGLATIVASSTTLVWHP